MALAFEMTSELQAELDQILQLCKDLRQLEPDIKVGHHRPGCGCPWKVSEETGLLDPKMHAVDRWIGDTEHVVYDTDYPFFICAECRSFVPWCFGCGHEDEYIAECCDDCAVELLGHDGGTNED